MVDTYKRTPIMAQNQLTNPEEGSFLHSCTFKNAKGDASRDPCNFPETYRQPVTGTLWPRLQTKGAQVRRGSTAMSLVTCTLKLHYRIPITMAPGMKLHTPQLNVCHREYARLEIVRC